MKKEKVVREKYRYHYMKSNREMIFRYDNAPHHRHIVTFPDNKHVWNNVVESSTPRIIEVLKDIELMILKISLN